MLAYSAVGFNMSSFAVPSGPFDFFSMIVDVEDFNNESHFVEYDAVSLG
jgi:hypothetical protein